MNRSNVNRGGIRFYGCIWYTHDGNFVTTVEAGHSRRWLKSQIDTGEIAHYDATGAASDLIKIQEIDLEYFSDMFTKHGNKRDREAHKEQAAYILNLIRTHAARVRISETEVIER